MQPQQAAEWCKRSLCRAAAGPQLSTCTCTHSRRPAARLGSAWRCWRDDSTFLKLVHRRPHGRQRQGSRAIHAEAMGPATTPHTLTVAVGEEEITFQTGEIGRQAAGAVLVQCRDTVLYTTTSWDAAELGAGAFAALQVNYQERFSAAGRTSGGFFKREGRPKDHEILVARLTDRPLRPMMPQGWNHSTQVLTWVLSYDGQTLPEPLAITAAGAAMAVSDVPMSKPVAGVRVGMTPAGEYIINPTVQQMEDSVLDLLVAGTDTAVLMIEGYCDFLSEEQLLEAVRLGAEVIADTCKAIAGWAASIGKPKAELLPPAATTALQARVQALAAEDIRSAYLNVVAKRERRETMIALGERLVAQLAPQQAGDQEDAEVSDGEGAAAQDGDADAREEATKQEIATALAAVEAGVMRRLILEEGLRSDGRRLQDVRPIYSRAGLLPRTHGSALFTRGETQAMAVATLGSKSDAQAVDAMELTREGQAFYLQYYFPPSCVGETGRVGGASRREVGHGTLAQRALAPTIPSGEDFPYTIRLESTITESNGSSSMASVCGGCLALLDAGVPIKHMVAGVAMGLVLDPAHGRCAVLTDILGTEDGMGDMDFKVAGSEDGVTAFQMDIKVEGVSIDILRQALQQAKEARVHILKEMGKCSPPPRRELSQYMQRILLFNVQPDKLGMVIGPGGRNIRLAEEATGATSITVTDNAAGRLEIRAPTNEILEAARHRIVSAITDPVPGQICRNAKVMEVKPFGCLVEVVPGKTGLVHVSELDTVRVQDATDQWQAGDIMDVKILDVDSFGKIKLSRKVLLAGHADSSSSGSSTSSFGSGGDEVEVGPRTPRRPELTDADLAPGAVCRDGLVVSLTAYGAFVEVQPGTRPLLLHVSEMDVYRVADPADLFEPGDRVDVVAINGRNGRVSLSRRLLLQQDARAKAAQLKA